MMNLKLRLAAFILGGLLGLLAGRMLLLRRRASADEGDDHAQQRQQ